MTASSYDGRKPEPPYHTDSDIVVDLQGQIDELTAERDHLRADLQRLQSSPAPVVGGVPEDQEWNGPLLGELLRMDSDEQDWEDAAKRVHDWFVSRLSSIKPGEEVVNSEEYAALLDFAERIVPIRDNLSGISWVGNLKDVFAAYDNWYAIRIAQATTNEGGAE